MIEIDHGNGLVSRYAHASKLLVKEGDLVVRGQRDRDGRSTGRSTGPHLHFEVRLNGVPQNPARFLQHARLSSDGDRTAKAARGEAVLTPCFLAADRTFARTSSPHRSTR